MNRITIIIPTLNKKAGEKTGSLALLMAGCEADLLVVVDSARRGFTKTVNKGMRQVDVGDICILNDDISRFQHGWLRSLQRGLYKQARYGIAGPSGKSASKSREGRVGMAGIEILDTLSFWCVLIKRKLINVIGVLDERFTHYCSDNDYCDRAADRKWKCVWVKSVYLEHQHHGSGLKGKWKQQDQREYRRSRKRGIKCL